MATHVAHGGRNTAHGTGATEVGLAGCGGPTAGEHGGTGATAGKQQHRLRRVCAAFRRWYPPLGAEAAQLSINGGQALGGGNGPQQGHGADHAFALTRGVAGGGIACPPAPRAPMAVANVGHYKGLPDARLRHALLCLAVAVWGKSLMVSVSLHRATTAM